MSQGIHLVSNCIPGCTLPDGKCQASGRAALLSSSSTRGHELFGGSNVLLETFSVSRPRTVSVRYTASNNNRRNPDFSRQQKGSYRGRNRRHQQRENSERQEETDPLVYSQNGSLLSLSNNQRYSSTATPGRREKEIVEIFRKVQAQLRERKAIKAEKKIEASQKCQGERGTANSLLKLLRKHSVTQGKKSGREEEFNSFEEEPNSNFFSSSTNITSDDEVLEADLVRFRRPASSFRRKSPVSQVQFQPVFSTDKGKKKGSVDEPEHELVALEEPVEEISDELSYPTDTDEIEEETVEPSAAEITDLASMKLSELRDLAKSRGAKGYSKLKKAELVELLS